MSEHLAQEPSEIFGAERKSAYLGSDVDWALRFADGYEQLPGYARLLFRSRARDVKYVAVTVPMESYPWLAQMKHGEPLQVHGRVSEISPNAIELTGVTLLRLSSTLRPGNHP